MDLMDEVEKSYQLSEVIKAQKNGIAHDISTFKATMMCERNN
jgi:hypothetical protein